MKYIFVLALGASLFFSCRFIGGRRVRGDGNLTTEQRSLSSFDQVTTSGSFDIVLVSGEQSVKVEAEENLQQYIETEVEGNKLKISTRSGYRIKPRLGVKIFVSAPTFRSISSHGSGNVNGQNLITSSDPVSLNVSGSGNISVEMNAPSIKAEIAGSGNMKLTGNVKEFRSGIYGSGDIKAAGLNTEEGDVEIAGSGNVEITASEKLHVSIMGSGGVRYRGDAQISSSIAGSGSINKIN